MVCNPQPANYPSALSLPALDISLIYEVKRNISSLGPFNCHGERMIFSATPTDGAGFPNSALLTSWGLAVLGCGVS